MTFTIGQTFDLLFATLPPGGGRIVFDDRRWFRRPPPLAVGDAEGAAEEREGESVDGPDLEQADEILLMRMKTSSRNWAKSAGSSPSIDIDLRRHAPPRLPYDVFAAAAYIIEQAGIYHHLQPLKTSPVVGAAPPAPAEDPRHIDVTEADRELVAKVAAT